MSTIALQPRIRRFTPWGAFILLPLFIASLSAAATPHCSTIIVGRLASADGSVLLAHNEDLQLDAAQHIVRVPHRHHLPGETIVLWSGVKVAQVPETFAYLGTSIFDKELIPGDLVTGINECQVAVANNLAFQRNCASDLTTGRMIWTEFMRIALERANTAKEAVRIIGECAQLYKLASDPGTMFGITDPQEGWWLEIAQEGQWVAQRVPDQDYAMRANAYRIGIVNFKDQQNFLSSPDLVTYAVQKGWYDPSTDGAFNFTEAYGMKSETSADHNTHRQKRADQLLTPLLPKISVTGLVALLRDHYEGSPWDHSGGPGRISPHGTDERTFCCEKTVASAVVQSRSWLPPEIGGVCWLAMSPPCTGIFIPWYMGLEKIPPPYQEGRNISSVDSAYWAFRCLANLVDKDYKKKINVVRNRWNELEKTVEQDQPVLEEKACRLYLVNRKKAIQLLNRKSTYYALRAFDIAKKLAKEIE
jgi:dipeptidase